MNHKQIILMASYLNMRKGKMVAQGAHASIAAMLCRAKVQGDELLVPLDADVGPWLSGQFKKICLKVTSEQELLELHAKALEAGLPCALITDSGLTEFNNVPTITCAAIGPAAAERIEPITSHLSLF